MIQSISKSFITISIVLCALVGVSIFVVSQTDSDRMIERGEDIAYGQTILLADDVWTSAVPQKSITAAQGKVRALLMPYDDSQLAQNAEIFASISHQPVKRVIIIGENGSRRDVLQYVSTTALWQTPLGIVRADQNAIDTLGAQSNDEIFKTSKSIIAHIPFIAKYFPKAKVVPVIVGGDMNIHDIQKKLFSIIDNSTLVIASTRLSSDTLQSFHNEHAIAVIRALDEHSTASLNVGSPPLISLFVTLLKTMDTGSSDKIGEAIRFYEQGEVFERPVSLLFFGDMMLGRTVEQKVTRNNLDVLFENMVPKSAKKFYGQDAVIANLEGPVVQTLAPKFKEIQFGFNPVVVPQLKSWGFDAFSLANNHALDQHYAGFEETQQHLEGNNLVWFGDQVKESDDSVEFIERAGKKIALVGFNITDNPFSIEEMKSVIKKAKEQADIVIVMMHWGNEYQHLASSPQQQEIGHALVDAGADAVIGAHPHVVQPMEVYQGVPIFYSLGNFIFDQYFSQATQEGLAVGLVIDQSTIKAYVFPFSSQGSIPRWMSQEQSNEWLNTFYEKSLLDQVSKVDGNVVVIDRIPLLR